MLANRCNFWKAILFIRPDNSKQFCVIGVFIKFNEFILNISFCFIPGCSWLLQGVFIYSHREESHCSQTHRLLRGNTNGL